MNRQSQPPERIGDEILRARTCAEAERIVAIVKDVRAPMQALEAAIAAHPVFTAHLLTLINFAAGFSQRVLSLGQAVSLLGLDYIKPLALGLLAYDLRLPPGTDDSMDLGWRIDLRGLWEHGLGNAAVASDLAVKTGVSPLRAFSAGFVHDIGRVLLLRHAPDGFNEAVLKNQEKGITISAAERQVFGIDHMALGDGWCRHADLSMSLQDTVRLHHQPLATLDPRQTELTRRLIALVQAAESACGRHEIGAFSEHGAADSAPWTILGLREQDCHERCVAIRHEIEAARELFGFPQENHRWVHRVRKAKSAQPVRCIEASDRSNVKRAQVIRFPQLPGAMAAAEDKLSIHNKLVLLVVEDHSSLCDMVSLFMMRHGYHVRTANNGASALEILSREEIHLVLLDLMLPKLDGFEVLRQVHRSPGERFPYIIVVSAGASDSDRRKVLDLGANEYMPKPFHLNRLLERVQAVEKFLY